MNAPTKTIYLSKDGKVSGPFDEAEIEAFRQSGELQNFGWIWYGAGRNWEPVNAPPPPPPGLGAPSSAAAPVVKAAASPRAGSATAAGTAARSASTKTITGSTQKAGPRSFDERNIQVICHDNRHIMSGWIQPITKQEFVLSSRDHLSEMPPFRKGGKVIINLLDERAGKTENAVADILAFDKKGTHWEYKMRWEAVPKFFADESTPAGG